MRAVAQKMPADMPRTVGATVSPMMMVKRLRGEFSKRIIPVSEAED
jgi:hypothetical protein